MFWIVLVRNLTFCEMLEKSKKRRKKKKRKKKRKRRHFILSLENNYDHNLQQVVDSSDFGF